MFYPSVIVSSRDRIVGFPHLHLKQANVLIKVFSTPSCLPLNLFNRLQTRVNVFKHTYGLLYPSIEHITRAALASKLVPHTDPHVPLCCISILPSFAYLLPTSFTFVAVIEVIIQHAHGRVWDKIHQIHSKSQIEKPNVLVIKS